MQNAKMIKCAHEPYTDHCLECMPYWEIYPVCPTHNVKLTHPLKGRGWCPLCKKHYEITEEM
jgi:hypothetical protein